MSTPKTRRTPFHDGPFADECEPWPADDPGPSDQDAPALTEAEEDELRWRWEMEADARTDQWYEDFEEAA